MTGRNYILSKLPLYTATIEIIKDQQSVNDIIKGVKYCHKKYAADYDKIAIDFIGDTPEQTCRNIFNFLRKEAFYFVESEEVQTLRSPSAIVATGKISGIDCKNYALFIGGVLDAINRSGFQYIPFVYRFASDKLLDPTPNHVFIVAFPETDHEIWIDPIPQVTYFNEHLFYSYHEDKKISAMLQMISGRTNQIGFVAQAKLTADVISKVLPFITNLFSNKPNPQDYLGWEVLDKQIGAPLGTNAQNWIIYDGDSVQNEALNIIGWIKRYGINTVINHSTWFNRDITMNDLVNKLTRGGYPQEAKQIIDLYNQTTTGEDYAIDPRTGGVTKKAGMNMLITLGIVGAGVYMLTKSKRKTVNGIGTPGVIALAAAAGGLYLISQKEKAKYTAFLIKMGLEDTPQNKLYYKSLTPTELADIMSTETVYINH